MKEAVTTTVIINSGGETEAVLELVKKAAIDAFDAHAINGVVDVNAESTEDRRGKYHFYVVFARICDLKPAVHYCNSIDYKDGDNLLKIKVHAKVVDRKNADDNGISKKIVEEIFIKIQGSG